MNIWSDSFEKSTSAFLLYDGSGGAPTISTATVRTGTQSMSCTNGNFYVFKNFTSRTTYIVGAAIFISSCPNEVAVIAVGDTATAQWGLTIDSSGTVRVRRGISIGGLAVGGTSLGSGSSLISFGAWHYLEVKVKIDSSTGTIDVQLDGSNILSLTGQNTQQTGNNTGNQVYLGIITNAGGNMFFDDYYVNDTSGSSNTSFLGDVSVLALFPNANGTLNNFTNVFASYVNGTAYVKGQQLKDSNNNVQVCTTAGTASNASPTWATTGGATTSVGGGCVFTVRGSGSNPGAANWMAVTEAPPDDNNSYVTDATPGDIDRYTFPAIAGSQVFSVNEWLRAEKDDSGTRTIRAAGKSGGTTFDNGTDFALTLNSYAYFLGVFQVDPNTGVAWTVSGVNAAEFGVKTTA